MTTYDLTNGEANIILGALSAFLKACLDPRNGPWLAPPSEVRHLMTKIQGKEITDAEAKRGSWEQAA